jgi:hypothetical protein
VKIQRKATMTRREINQCQIMSVKNNKKSEEGNAISRGKSTVKRYHSASSTSVIHVKKTAKVAAEMTITQEQ